MSINWKQELSNLMEIWIIDEANKYLENLNSKSDDLAFM